MEEKLSYMLKGKANVSNIKKRISFFNFDDILANRETNFTTEGTEKTQYTACFGDDYRKSTNEGNEFQTKAKPLRVNRIYSTELNRPSMTQRRNTVRESSSKFRNSNFQRPQPKQEQPRVSQRTKHHFPPDIYFLLAEEESNINSFKDRIAIQKEKASEAFDSELHRIRKLMEEMKGEVISRLDNHYMLFINRYKIFKELVNTYKSLRRQCIFRKVALPREYEEKSNKRLLKELAELDQHQEFVEEAIEANTESEEVFDKAVATSTLIVGQLSNPSSLIDLEKCRVSLNSFSTCLQKIRDLELSSIISCIEDPNKRESLKTLYIKEEGTREMEKPRQMSIDSCKRSQFSGETAITEKETFKKKKSNLPFNFPSPIVSNVQNVTSRKSNINGIYFPGHSEMILSTLFIDSENVACGSRDCSVRIFNLKKKKTTSVLQGHNAAILCLATDGNYLASGSDIGDCSIIIWNLVDSKSISKLEKHNAAVSGIAFSQNVLVSCSYDRNLIVWDFIKGRAIKIIKEFKASLCAIKNISNGIVCGTLDGNLSHYSFFSNNNLEFKAKADCSFSLVSFEISKLNIIAYSADGEIGIIDIRSFYCIRKFVPGINNLVKLLIFNGWILSFERNSSEIKIYNEDFDELKFTNLNGVSIEYSIGISPVASVKNIQGDDYICSVNQSGREFVVNNLSKLFI